MMQSRTHNCGELRLSDAGKAVTIVGWMENVREVGSNFAFVVLRDFYGTTQVVIETEEMMKAVKGLNKETTISVTGTVRDGDVILLHDMCDCSVDAALNIIDRLQAQGFCFVTASELAQLRGVTPEPGKVSNRFV